MSSRVSLDSSHFSMGWLTTPLTGYGNSCDSSNILDNQLGPAGHAPSGVQQFKRDSTGEYPPGQWVSLPLP